MKKKKNLITSNNFIFFNNIKNNNFFNLKKKIKNIELFFLNFNYKKNINQKLNSYKILKMKKNTNFNTITFVSINEKITCNIYYNKYNPNLNYNINIL